MGSKRAVLWDLDGVLVDSGELHFQAWEQTLAPLSIPFDREKFAFTFGMNNQGVLTVLLGRRPEPEFYETVSNLKERRFRGVIHGQLKLLPGAKDWLERLGEAGFPQAIASSAPYPNIEAMVDEVEIRGYFSAMVSAYDMPGKPDPAVFLEAARQLGIEPAVCTVVEDSVAGIAAARRAGMKCVAVTTTHPRASVSSADLIVESLEKLTFDDFR